MNKFVAVYNWSKALLENDMSSALKVNKGEGKGTATFLKQINLVSKDTEF